MALTLTAALDAFCRNVPDFASLGQLLHAVVANLKRFILLLFQLLVFIFTMVRFYWGTVRYHEEVCDQSGTPYFLVGLLGEVSVFSVFYVTAIVVKQPRLFYASFCVALSIDLVWFLAARWWRRSIQVPQELQVVWGWYLWFDLLTILPVAILLLVAHCVPHAEYSCDMLSLSVIAGIGVWDFTKFWPYYAKKKRLGA